MLLVYRVVRKKTINSSNFNEFIEENMLCSITLFVLATEYAMCYAEICLP